MVFTIVVKRYLFFGGSTVAFLLFTSLIISLSFLFFTGDGVNLAEKKFVIPDNKKLKNVNGVKNATAMYKLTLF